MAGSLSPVMYWAIRPTLCSALWSDNEQLPYQEVMQLGRDALDGAAVEPFEDLGIHAKSFQSLEGEKVLSCPVHDCLGMFGT